MRRFMRVSEDDVELQTVNHKARVAALFGLVVWGILAIVFWITATPKRWIALILAIAGALGLYATLR